MFLRDKKASIDEHNGASNGTFHTIKEKEKLRGESNVISRKLGISIHFIKDKGPSC